MELAGLLDFATVPDQEILPIVDSGFRSSVRGLYVIGDVTGAAEPSRVLYHAPGAVGLTGEDVLVVGGGNSAIEAVWRLGWLFSIIPKFFSNLYGFYYLGYFSAIAGFGFYWAAKSGNALIWRRNLTIIASQWTLWWVSGAALLHYLRFWFVTLDPVVPLLGSSYGGETFFDRIVVWFEHGIVLIALGLARAFRPSK